MKKFDDFYNEYNYYSGGFTKGIKKLIEDANIPKGNALDIGAGQGRNTFMLKDSGFNTYAVEPSKEGCKVISGIAAKFDKPINVFNSTFQKFNPNDTKFDLIIAITSLDHMSESDVVKSVKRIKEMLTDNGYVYITCFMEGDQGNIDREKFASDTAIFIRHYFRKNQLKELFDDLKIVKYEEIHSVDTSHGPKHYHETALLIAQKTNDKITKQSETQDEKFIRNAIEISKTAKSPYGAIVVKNNKIIGRSDSLEQKNILEHAEYRAILDAITNYSSDLSGAVLYTSCEPCVCCYGVVFNTNIDKIVFAATLEDSKKYYFNENIIKTKENNKLAERPLKVVEELCRDEAVEVLKKAKLSLTNLNKK